MFNTANTKAHHLTQSWISSIHFSSLQLIFLRYVLMSSSHLFPGLPSDSFPKFSTNYLSPHPICRHSRKKINLFSNM
jgi:hypothetical protein